MDDCRRWEYVFFGTMCTLLVTDTLILIRIYCANFGVVFWLIRPRA